MNLSVNDYNKLNAEQKSQYSWVTCNEGNCMSNSCYCGGQGGWYTNTQPRPCNCGSGQPATTCDEADQFCG